MFSFGKPSKKTFAMQLCEAIESVNEELKFRYNPSQFCLVAEDDEDQVVNLSNLYKEHCSLPKAERDANIYRVASIFSSIPDELPEDFEEARASLRPKIWNRSTFEFMELKKRLQGGEAIDLPLYPVGSHLYSTLVYDTENAMRSLSNEDLERWGVSYYEAFEIACENLDEATTAFAGIGDHFFSSATSDSYDSSRVMLLDKIRSFPAVGDRIAMVPQRDTLHLACTEDEQSLLILFDLTEKTLEDEPRPLCPLPMRLQDGEWVDWQPPMNHVLRPRYDDLELRYLGGLYGEQKELLDEIMLQEADGFFVATFSAVKKDGAERPLSYCVWSDGVEALLPKTQLVMFASDDGMAAIGEWNHVMSVVGDMMKADDSYYPVRYKVTRFPSQQQLDEIGMLEI